MVLRGSPDNRLSSDSVAGGRCSLDTPSRVNARSSSDFGTGIGQSPGEWKRPSPGSVTHSTLGAFARPEGGAMSAGRWVLPLSWTAMLLDGFDLVTDVIGRRKALILSVAGFSAFTLLCAVAPSAFACGLLRSLAGPGLGGCPPSASAWRCCRRAASYSAPTSWSMPVSSTPTSAAAA